LFFGGLLSSFVVSGKGKDNMEGLVRLDWKGKGKIMSYLTELIDY